MGIKKSVVKSVQGSGTWDTKKEPIKTFYKYEIEMENGDSGEYSSISDSQDKFIEGVEVEYIYTGGEYPKIKPYYNNPNTGSYSYSSSNSKEDEQIARSVGVKAAVELGIAEGLTIKDLSEILETAKILADFITTEKVIEVKESESVPF